MSLFSILIVDDNDIDRELIVRQIKRAKLADHIYEESDGEKALNFLSDYRKNSDGYPLLIFLDINMPRMNGFEFLDKFEELKRETDNFSMTVLTMFTSSERQEDVDKAMSYGSVKGYIVKMPLSSNELKEIIKKHFPNKF